MCGKTGFGSRIVLTQRREGAKKSPGSGWQRLALPGKGGRNKKIAPSISPTFVRSSAGQADTLADSPASAFAAACAKASASQESYGGQGADMEWIIFGLFPGMNPVATYLSPLAGL